MTDPVILILLAVAFAAPVLGVGWLLWFDRREARQMLDEFERRFPGQCLICSYHRFGLQHGFERDAEPKPHPCPNRPKGQPYR